MPSLLHSALDFAKRGLRVVPLHHIKADGNCSCQDAACSKRKGKHPRRTKWQKRATTDADRIQRDWKTWPEANLGIATGQGLIVIDIDGDAGAQQFSGIVKGQSIPPTVEVITGSGGRHLYFKYPSELTARNKKLDKNIDVRGDGGQVVAPPSRHASGQNYKFLRHPREGIAELPIWLFQLLRKNGNLDEHPQESHGGPSSVQGKSAEAQRPGLVQNAKEAKEDAFPASTLGEGSLKWLLAEMIDRYPILDQGQRNDRMHRAVAALANKGLNPSEIGEVMNGWLQHFQSNYSTPYEEAISSLHACIKSLFKKIDAGEFIPALINHQDRRNQLVLPSSSLQLLETDFSCQSLSLCHPHLKGGDKKNKKLAKPLCQNEQEKAFVKALLVMLHDEQTRTPEGNVKITNKDLQDLMEVRWNQSADNRQLERLKKKFITREEQGPAEKVELMMELVKGKRSGTERIPSLFKPTNIQPFIDLGSPAVL